jgi:hypothetical protein
MARVKLEVNKLENGTAEFISLVTRGANRLPFKIVKQHPPQESDMINLGGKLDLSDIRNVLKADGDTPRQSRGQVIVAKDADPKPADPAPVLLAGIVVEKGDLTEEDMAELTAIGVDTTNAIENDDETVLFAQGDAEPGDAVVVKMNDGMLALVTGLDAETIVKGTPFESLYEEMGFLPSRTEALDGADVALKSDADPMETAAEATRLTGYVDRLTKALPEVAIKAEAIVAKACKKRKLAAQAALDAAAVAKAEAEAPIDCPMCEAKGCKACGGEGKVLKADASRMELLLKAFPPKKPAAAAAAPAAAAPAAAAPAAPAAAAMPPPEENDDGSEAPEGVDEDAWTKMTPDEKATVNAAAQGSAPAAAAPAADANAAPSAPADPNAPAKAMPAAAPAAAAPAAAPKKPFPAKKDDASQEGDAAVTIPAMDANVQKMLTEMAANMALITKSVGDLATEVASVKATAQKAETTAAVVANGTMIGGVPADDRQPATPVKKHEALGIIDTAFQKGVRVQKSYAQRQAAASAVRR